MKRTVTWLCSAILFLSVGAAAPPKIVPPEPGLPADASWDNRISPSLPGVDGYVLATTVFNGELIVAGRFTYAGTTPAEAIAAWNGSSWSALGRGLRGEGTPAEVRNLAVFNGKLIASGYFYHAGEAAANGIAQWDGSTWSPLGSGFPNTDAYALAVFGGNLVAGGGFRIAGGTSVSCLAAWDGVSWTNFGSGVSGSAGNVVYALAVLDDMLIVGGRFTRAGGIRANNVASTDGVDWFALGAGRSSTVGNLAIFQDQLIAGGTPIDASTLASWNGSTWTTLGQDGPHRTGALLVYGNRLIVSGHLGGSGLASWDGAAWSEVAGGPDVNALGLFEDRLIAGGSFGSAGGIPAQGIASWDGSSWSGFYSGTPGVAGPVLDLAVFDGKLYAGGEFTSAGDVAGRIAAWDGTSWSALGSGTGGPVTSLSVFDGRLIAGGGFAQAGGIPALNLAAWNGESWAALGTGIDLPVSALTTYHDHLIAGDQQEIPVDCLAGAFPDCRSGLVSVKSWDGSAWSPLGPPMDGFFGSFAVYDDRLLTLRDLSLGLHGDIGAWDGSRWSSVNPDYPLPGGTTIHEGRLLVGAVIPFVVWGGYGLTFRIDAWDGTSWSPLETDLDGAVWAMAHYDNKLIAGGDFTTIGGVEANHIAAWDGVRWSPLGSGTDGPVHRLAVHDGGLVVAGDFHAAGGKPSQSLAVWRVTRHVALDVLPGSCSNPLSDNGRPGRGSAVLPVAILGSEDLDVRQIDMTSVTLNGTRPIRWGYEDLGAPAGASEKACACPAAGADGRVDLTLAFPRDAILSSLRGQDSPVVRVEGRLLDGSRFEGTDCVTVVGRAKDRLSRGVESPSGYTLAK